MTNRPIQFQIALVLAVAETITSAAVTGIFAYALISGQTAQLGIMLSIIALLVGATIFLAKASQAFYQLKRWGRSAIIFWQFLQISIGWGTLDGKTGIAWLAAIIFVVSGLTAIMLFTKPVGKLFDEN